MKIKNNQKSYVDIKIKSGPSFKYELPISYEYLNEDLSKKGYSLSKGELSYVNSHSQKILIKSKNDFISLLRKAQKSSLKLELIYEKEIIDSFIADLEFIKIQNVYSDLNTDESNIDLSQSFYNNGLNVINESDDIEFLSNGISIILEVFMRKYFMEFIVKLKGEEFYNNKFGKKIIEQIPKNKLSESINLNYNFPCIDNLIKKSKIPLINNEEEIINNLYDHFEKFEDIRKNNNSIYQTMIKNKSKLSLLIKDSKVNNTDNKIYETQINRNTHFNECNNCHIKLIKDKRYKCTKCINYILCEKCEEKNFDDLFHPHTEFIQIRIDEKNIFENPYSYQCLTKNLVFNFSKENLIDDELIIKDILLKNNFILPWPGNNNTYIKCDKSLSTIFCEKINLPKLSLGNSVNIDFIFLKINKLPKGKYKCICNFFVNNIKYGMPLELEVNLI